MYFPKNKKAQIPILMLFAVTIVLVLVALFSFVSFSTTSGLEKLSSDVSNAIGGSANYKNLVTSLSKNAAFAAITSRGGELDKSFSDEIASYENRWEDNQKAAYGNFFARVRDGEFEFIKVEEFARLKISNLSTQIEVGNNKIREDFDLCMLFDSEGMNINRISAAKLYSSNCPAE